MITGASSGIGEALAHIFYEAGCKVVLAARREHELERVCHNLLNLHLNKVQTHRPEVVPLDLADISSLASKASTILEKCGHVDILINNGGVSLRSDVLTAKTEVDARVMNINYLGTVALTKGKVGSLSISVGNRGWYASFTFTCRLLIVFFFCY